MARVRQIRWCLCSRAACSGQHRCHRGLLPSDSPEKIENLRAAIVGSLTNIESQTAEFVAENPYILDHYRQSLLRYLKDQTERQAQGIKRNALRWLRNPTEYLNVFGIAYRYLRYLRVRKRIKATSTKQYGRLAPQEMPSGELHIRGGSRATSNLPVLASRPG